MVVSLGRPCSGGVSIHPLPAWSLPLALSTPGGAGWASPPPFLSPSICPHAPPHRVAAPGPLGWGLGALAGSRHPLPVLITGGWAGFPSLLWAFSPAHSPGAGGLRSLTGLCASSGQLCELQHQLEDQPVHAVPRPPGGGAERGEDCGHPFPCRPARPGSPCLPAPTCRHPALLPVRPPLHTPPSLAPHPLQPPHPAGPSPAALAGLTS